MSLQYLNFVLQKTCATRHKGFNIVNIHSTVKFIALLAMKHMPEKLRNRTHFFSDFDEIDLIEKHEFPVDCGGNVENEKFIGKSAVI